MPSFPPPLALLGLLLLGCATPPRDPETAALRRIILDQVARHPHLEPRDLYKLLNQAAMGSEHAVEDTISVRLWMNRELETMGEGPAEPLVDTIAPGGRVVLVHLRPWIAAGRSTDSLLAAFVRTATVIRPDTLLLGRYLATADTLVRAGGLPFGAAAWRDMVQGLRRAGYPAVHHSDGFMRTYRPAYRVIAGTLLP
ncbi:MAG: hypothetical protein ABIQ41_10800 [Gemmatimonadales bacterium]